jgi:hypothetical protein
MSDLIDRLRTYDGTVTSNNLCQEAADVIVELQARLLAMMPLFEEARDALTAISLASARLHGVRLDLADRMDDVGDPERWAARRASASGGTAPNAGDGDGSRR